MIKFFFIVPLLLCILWWAYLRQNDWTIEQGKKGFYYIIGLSGVVSLFYLLMYVLNHYLS
ncbi:MAG: hypothetical protein HWE10_06470 [Gammaproteobacteria bacterium]|nr:hypothetical protein [Gammaproteobacteria bacterium]